MTLFRTDTAFGLPEGTIRAVLALGLTGAWIYGTLLGTEMPEGFTGVVGIVNGFYFKRATK